MSKKRKAALIFIILSVLVVTVLILNTGESVDVDVWSDFKQGIIKKHTYINDISVYSITPPRIKIQFFLDEELSMEDVGLIFEETRKFILSENIFKELQTLHIKKYKNRFGEIHIIFTYRENSHKSKYEFSSAQEVDGEPNHNSFNTWYIKFNDEPTSEYTPESK